MKLGRDPGMAISARQIGEEEIIPRPHLGNI
jgi:hypothetical protein